MAVGKGSIFVSFVSVSSACLQSTCAWNLHFASMDCSSFCSNKPKTYRDGIRVGHGVPTGHEILFGFVGVEHDREDSRLHLCDVRNMVGCNSVFSLCSGYNDRLHLGTVIDRLVGHAKVQRDRVGNLRRFAAETLKGCSASCGSGQECLGNRGRSRQHLSVGIDKKNLFLLIRDSVLAPAKGGREHGCCCCCCYCNEKVSADWPSSVQSRGERERHSVDKSSFPSLPLASSSISTFRLGSCSRNACFQRVGGHARNVRYCSMMRFAFVPRRKMQLRGVVRM